jgi:hypothetical protein
VVDRLRRFWNRPLSDADRPRLFAIAVAVIAAGAAVFWLLDRGAPARPRAATPPPAAAFDAPVATSTATPAAASSTDVAHAKRAARRFLAGYLPYSYGRGDAGRIAAAGRELRDRLARQPPRVPARERRRRPRLVLVQTEGVSPAGASLTALVDDGARRYSVALELARTPAGWNVTDVGA